MLGGADGHMVTNSAALSLGGARPNAVVAGAFGEAARDNKGALMLDKAIGPVLLDWCKVGAHPARDSVGVVDPSRRRSRKRRL